MIAQQVIFGSNLVIFRGRLRAVLCFYYKVFRIELRSECVNTKNLEFFHGMFLHSSVAMETCFGQLRLYLGNSDS